VQHIYLTLLAVGIGFALSFALALLAFRFRFPARRLGPLGALVYCLPRIALFTILLPITGVGVTTIVIPLTAYTLFVLYPNILAGLRSVPADVLESARGMGTNRTPNIWRVELPLAVPAIMAGLRVATVATIAIATVAAFLIHYGLGAPIFDPLEHPDIFRTELLAASVLAILLALAADALLALLQRALTPWSRIR